MSPKRYHVPLALPPTPPPARARRIDGHIAVPRGGAPITATIRWRFASNDAVRVNVRNAGEHPAELVGVYPDGTHHRLAPGRTAELSLIDGTEQLALTARSEHGTHLEIHLPCHLAKRKVVRRDQQQLIESIVESVEWVPSAD